MTIGIGAICQNTQCVIMAADRRGTYGKSGLQPHEHIGKQFDLPLNLFANISGVVNVCGGVVSALYAHMEAIASAPPPAAGFIGVEKIREAISNAQIMELSVLYDAALVNNLGGMRLKEWQESWPSRPRLRSAGRAVFRLTPFEVELTVGGFLNGSPLLLSVYGKEAAQPTMDLSVIGSGWPVALDHLNVRGQNPSTSCMRSALHIWEAMEAAKVEPTVGEQCDFIIITPAASRRLPSSYAKELAARWAGKNLDRLDESKGEFDAFMAAMYVPGIPRACFINRFGLKTGTYM